jgi:hypothetical protein
MRTLIKKYLKSLNKDERDFRLVFMGARHKARQYHWLHYHHKDEPTENHLINYA